MLRVARAAGWLQACCQQCGALRCNASANLPTRWFLTIKLRPANTDARQGNELERVQAPDQEGCHNMANHL
eukprot:6462517-Amphidinium_carterae.1